MAWRALDFHLVSERPSQNNWVRGRGVPEHWRLHHDNLEITLVDTSHYWRKFVDRQTLQHDSIIGVRKKDGSTLERKELQDVGILLAYFLGWINHCVTPMFHVKGYRKGSLVYKGYNVHPHPTVQRDSFSWLPLFGAEDDNGAIGRHATLVQGLLDGFAQVWAKNERENGVFHIALQMLRSNEKGLTDVRAFSFILARHF